MNILAGSLATARGLRFGLVGALLTMLIAPGPLVAQYLGHNVEPDGTMTVQSSSSGNVATWSSPALVDTWFS